MALIGGMPSGEVETVVIDQLRTAFRHLEIVVGTGRDGAPRDTAPLEACAFPGTTLARPAFKTASPAWAAQKGRSAQSQAAASMRGAARDLSP